MAKVKTAKEKITAYFKAKGLDAADIKDAFDELDAADTDLSSLADQLPKYKEANDGWSKFWNETATPALTQLTEERDALKAHIDRLKAAGFQVGDIKAPVLPKGDENQYVTPKQLEEFQRNIASASSAVMKSLSKISLKHFKTFNEDPDLDGMEKLIAEGKARDIDHAYDVLYAPKYEARRTEETQKQIDEGIKKGIQDALSKQGISAPRKKRDADVQAESYAEISATLKDKKGPSDRDLRESFISDLNNDSLTH